MMDQYEKDKYITTVDGLKETLDKYGVDIIPNILSPPECRDMRVGKWSYIEHISQNLDVPFSRYDSNTWRSFSALFPLHSMLLQRWGIGQVQFIWDIRQNTKLVDVFAKLYNVSREELLVSFDGASFHFPPEKTRKGWFRNNNWLHTDQSYTRPDFECIQSWVTARKVNRGDATLIFLEGSHKYHKKFCDKFKVEKSDWYKLEKGDQYEFYSNCPRKYIMCDAGSLVLWDSRTIHMGQECLRERKKKNIRCIAYICYTPRSLATPAMLRKKVKAFEKLRTTSHWPHKPKLFFVNPRTYGKTIPDIPVISNPVLTELGKKLAGY